MQTTVRKSAERLTAHCELMVFHAAFGVPSESADASLLQAWLTRNAALPMGLVLRVPPGAPANVTAHLTHLLQRLLKVALSAECI